MLSEAAYTAVSLIRRPAIGGIVLLFLAVSLTEPVRADALSGGSVEIGRNDHFVVVFAGAGETYERLAARHLGDRRAAWYVARYNDNRKVKPGRTVVVPLGWRNAGGVGDGGYQVVPILSYHHFGDRKHQLSITAEQFREQLSYLRDNGYHVIPLQSLVGFLDGHHGLPPRSVVITIDDGYQSAYTIAFPLLREFGYPATIFPYTDYINNGGLKTAQMQEMAATGLIDFQPHSMSHANLALIDVSETPQQYNERIAREITASRQRLVALLGATMHSFAYPYGDVTQVVLQTVAAANYLMAFTVEAHANPFFANPLLLGRRMVFHDHTIEDFAGFLATREAY
jgi:peptidoglycan/xylan/chitin deacetylase (PgdA/CDA1 family)